MPQLIFYVESGYPQIYNLLTRKTTIGRNDDSDIHLDDPRVSVRHAELVRTGDGIYQLNDLNSDNGTAVNRKLVDDVVLKDGDQIKFGPVNASYVDQSESDEDKLLRQTVERDLTAKSEKLAKIEETIRERSEVLEKIPDSKRELESIEQSLAELVQKNDIARNNLMTVQNEIENSEQRRIDLLTDLKTQEAELEELEKDRAELQQQYRRNHSANENASKLKGELEADLEHLRSEIETERAALNEHVRALVEARETIETANELQGRMAEFNTGIKTRENNFQHLGENIVNREATLQELDQQIVERNQELEQLLETLESKQGDADNLSKVIIQNNDHIRSSSEMLVNMESTLDKEIDELSRSDETQKALQRQSLSLSHLISGKTALLQRLNDKFNARKNGVEPAPCPPLRVIDPAMRSLVQYFKHGASAPDEDRVNPVGFNGMAACTKGSMHREPDTIPEGYDPVLIVLHGDMEKDKELIGNAVRSLPHRIILVCWRQRSLDAMADAQEAPLDPRQIASILPGVTGFISVDARSAELIDGFRIRLPHLHLPLPCPVEMPEWNVPLPNAKRSRGIFVSMNGYDPNSIVHKSRVNLINQIVAATGTTVSLYHPNLVPGFMDDLKVPADLIVNIDTPLKYSEYLGFMRQHHFVCGFGINLEGGDVLGDALLSKTVFLGTNFENVIDQLLFPGETVKGGEIESALKNAVQLLTDHEAFIDTVDKAQSLALELISFDTVSERLCDFFEANGSKIHHPQMASTVA